MVIPVERVAALEATRVICGGFLLSLGRLDSTNMTWNISPGGLSERLVALAARFAFGFLGVWWLWLLATLDF